jgi:hypothetical protein
MFVPSPPLRNKKPNLYDFLLLSNTCIQFHSSRILDRFASRIVGGGKKMDPDALPTLGNETKRNETKRQDSNKNLPEKKGWIVKNYYIGHDEYGTTAYFPLLNKC